MSVFMPAGVRHIRVVIVIAVVVVSMSYSMARARPQYTYGVGCMYTTHVYYGTPGPEDDEEVYVDPGDGYDETNGTWTTEYKRYNSVLGTWDGEWRRIDSYGDVDALRCCGDPITCTNTGDVRIWTFQTEVMPLEIYTNVAWRIHVDEGYVGYGCDTSLERDVVVDVDANGYDIPGTSACNAGQGHSDFGVPVVHD